MNYVDHREVAEKILADFIQGGGKAYEARDTRGGWLVEFFGVIFKAKDYPDMGLESPYGLIDYTVSSKGERVITGGVIYQDDDRSMIETICSELLVNRS